MSRDWSAELDQACADGKVGVEDADLIREFGEFLDDIGPSPKSEGHDRKRYRAGIAKHHDLVFGGPPPHPAGCPGCQDQVDHDRDSEPWADPPPGFKVVIAKADVDPSDYPDGTARAAAIMLRQGIPILQPIEAAEDGAETEHA